MQIGFWRSKFKITVTSNLVSTIFQECIEEFMSNLAQTYTFEGELILEVKGLWDLTYCEAEVTLYHIVAS